MPILLTSPKDVGDLDPNAVNGVYTQLKIVFQGCDLKKKMLELTLEHGNTVNGEWVSGILPPIPVFIVNIPELVDGNGNPIAAVPHYNTLVAVKPDDLQVSYYDGTAKTLYQWLIDNDWVDGTIV